MSTRPLKPLSRLARKLCKQLLHTATTPDIEHPDTRVIIEGRTAYNKVSKFVPNAIGAYYIAFGYYYVLCAGHDGVEDNVAVYTVGTRKLVGYVYKTLKGIFLVGTDQC